MDILSKINEMNKKLPKFDDGRINYHDSDEAPVITVFLSYNDEILLFKRSNKVATYHGKWNAIAGYLDEIKPIRYKVLEEIKEETSLTEKDIETIHIGKAYKLRDEEIEKTWFIQPVLVKLNHKPKIKIDWEHTEYKWIRKEDINKFDVVKGVDVSLKNSFK